MSALGKTVVTYAAALARARTALSSVSPTAALDGRVLLAFALGGDHADVIARGRESADPAVLDEFQALVARRAAGEPIAYIIGEQEFCGHAFTVSPNVLIPRPETESLVETALAARPTAKRVLDLGTGSGCLVLSLLCALGDAEGEGWDISDAALRVAATNATRLGVAGRVTWREQSFSTPSADVFDVIVSNPPYIKSSASLPTSVAAYEPPAALFAGDDGLDAYRTLAASMPQMLAPGGVVLLEIGAEQGRAVQRLMADAFPDAAVSLHQDLAGLDRMVRVDAK